MHFRLSMPQLAAFVRLAELGSFRDAAAAMGVSQPALSRTIQLIEGRVGVRLFDRDSRRVSLTPAGGKFLPLALRLLENYQSAFTELDEFVSGRQGQIRIASLPSVATSLLPKTIADFQAKRPGVRIELWEDIAGPVHQAVEENNADIGLVTPSLTHEHLAYRHLVKDELVLVCRRDDPLAQADSHDWRVFLDRPFIGMSTQSDLHGLLENAFVQVGEPIQSLYNCKQPATVCALIEESLGISALPRLTLMRSLSPNLTWRPLRNPVLARSIGIVTLAGRSVSPATLQFIREIEAHAKLLRTEVPER